MMPLTRNRWLSVGFGGLGFGLLSLLAVRIVIRQLDQIRQLNQVTHSHRRPQLVCQETEDALKLETLQTLAEGSNWDLRAAALKIVAERSTGGETYGLLLANIASEDETTQLRALVALRFLSQRATPEKLNTPATLRALTDCLCNVSAHLYPDGRSTAITPKPIQSRPQPERVALTILSRLLQFGIGPALKAGIVTRWLANYPVTMINDDVLLSEIASKLRNSWEGRQQLNAAGVSYAGLEGISDRGTWIVEGEGTIGQPTLLNADGTFRRPRDSIEEQTLRRRRREAMVFLEEPRPLSNDDIIQRQEGPSDGNTQWLSGQEQEIDHILDEIRGDIQELQSAEALMGERLL